MCVSHEPHTSLGKFNINISYVNNAFLSKENNQIFPNWQIRFPIWLGYVIVNFVVKWYRHEIYKLGVVRLMKKKITLLLTLAAGILIFSGCSKSDTIVESKAGNISEDEFYEVLKERYGRET